MASSRSTSASVLPSKRSWTRTRRVHRCRCTRGTRTEDPSPSSAVISAIASTSRRKSSSARRLSANCPSTSPDRTLWPSGVRRCASSASSASAARSRSMTSSTPGRCTFTTTASPECELRAVGLTDRRGGDRLPVERGERLLDRPAELLLEHGPHVLRRLRRDPVLELAQLLADLGREQVDAGGGDLTELHVDATGLLEGPAQPDADRVRRRRGRRLGRRGTARGPPCGRGAASSR